MLRQTVSTAVESHVEAEKYLQNGFFVPAGPAEKSSLRAPEDAAMLALLTGRAGSF